MGNLFIVKVLLGRILMGYYNKDIYKLSYFMYSHDVAMLFRSEYCEGSAVL